MTLAKLEKLGFKLVREKAYRVQPSRTGRYITLHPDTGSDGRRYFQFVDKDGDILLVEEFEYGVDGET